MFVYCSPCSLLPLFVLEYDPQCWPHPSLSIVIVIIHATGPGLIIIVIIHAMGNNACNNSKLMIRVINSNNTCHGSGPLSTDAKIQDPRSKIYSTTWWWWPPPPPPPPPPLLLIVVLTLIKILMIIRICAYIYIYIYIHTYIYI